LTLLGHERRPRRRGFEDGVKDKENGKETVQVDGREGEILHPKRKK